MSSRACNPDEASVRPLRHEEIDRRIAALVADLRRAEDDGAELRPRWISAAELVRRMKPFMVWN